MLTVLIFSYSYLSKHSSFFLILVSSAIWFEPFLSHKFIFLSQIYFISFGIGKKGNTNNKQKNKVVRNRIQI